MLKVVNSADDYIVCYLSGQIADGDWIRILAERQDVAEEWQRVTKGVSNAKKDEGYVYGRIQKRKAEKRQQN